MVAQGSTDSPAGLPVDNPSKSYWLTEQSEILLGHRTTKDLPQAADVVIVGSGITGTFAAHCLKEKAPNLNVVMLEAREACSGATGRVGSSCYPYVWESITCKSGQQPRNLVALRWRESVRKLRVV